MTKLFLGIIDICISLFLWVPFGMVCLSAANMLKRLLRHRFTRKNVSAFLLSVTYITAFIYLYIYRPDALAPVFCMVTCLVPVGISSRRLMNERN